MPSSTILPHITPHAARPAPTQPRVADQAAVFRWLRMRLIRNGLRVAMESCKIKLFTMISTSFVVAAFVFGISWYGLHEMFAFKVPAGTGTGSSSRSMAGSIDLMG